MRTVPDVSMTAADHDGYVLLENGSYWVIAGTSASSPSFAGVMALVVQAQGGTGLGNANPELYALSKTAHNPFHATPLGDNTVPGVAGFTATGGTYNLATGLGSVDGAMLVSAWGGGSSLVKPGPVRGPIRQRCAMCFLRP
jgi:subtilase family serine protease